MTLHLRLVLIVKHGLHFCLGVLSNCDVSGNRCCNSDIALLGTAWHAVVLHVSDGKPTVPFHLGPQRVLHSYFWIRVIRGTTWLVTPHPGGAELRMYWVVLVCLASTVIEVRMCCKDAQIVTFVHMLLSVVSSAVV